MPKKRTLYMLHDAYEQVTRSYCLLSEEITPQQQSDLVKSLAPALQDITGTMTKTSAQEDRVVVTWRHSPINNLWTQGRKLAKTRTGIEDILRDGVPRVCGWTPPEVVILANRQEAERHDFHIPRHLDL